MQTAGPVRCGDAFSSSDDRLQTCLTDGDLGTTRNIEG